VIGAGGGVAEVEAAVASIPSIRGPLELAIFE
jgi:hypothetical protein